ncbi:MAG: ImmA/IrrE family metallo-endopeptidase [Candidatus Aminicenantes bacterium]|nr:ImmA/IrrE family metallo-endopeptidase [Candidatus Aminicenantes bacterium]
MKEKNEIASLLKNERESLGLTLKEVSEKMEFAHYQTLSNIESGEREIKAWELAKLSNIYSRDIDFFLWLEKRNKEANILWRNPEESVKKKETERKFLSFCEKYQNLLKLIGEKEQENKELFLHVSKNNLLNRNSFEYVSKIASDYLNLLQLGSRPACSLEKILEEKVGIKIIHLELDPEISGGSTVGDFGVAILINANDAPWRRNYDLAHEFFHLITWNYFSPEEIYKKDRKGKNRIEQLADVFASAFLLPEDELRNEFSKKSEKNYISYLNLIETAREFGVSIEALLWRLVNLNLIKKDTVIKELEKGSIKDVDRKYRNSYLDGEKPYLSSKYISLAIKAFQMGKISKAKFAEYVDKKFSEVSSFIKKYGYDENEDYSVTFRTT